MISMSCLWYFVDLIFALPLLWFKFSDFLIGLSLSLFISFSMRGYEGVVLSDKERQSASTLGSVVLLCFFAFLCREVSIFVALPALAAVLFRHFLLFKLLQGHFEKVDFMLFDRIDLPSRVSYDEFKRFLDIFVGLLFMIASLPLILLISLVSLLFNKRPIFICQDRVGRNCEIFKMYKFRTYQERDNRNEVTLLGRVIRPLRLDELPQIFNIVKGDMSLVGPRPELPSFHRLGMENIEGYWQRLLVRPGLTGWAQINYKYTTTVEEYRIKTAYDLFYVKNRSFILDFKCVFKTPYAIMLTLLERGEQK